MINSSEISVIIQGAIDKKYTYLTVASVLQHLPKAEIIISTWDDSKVNIKGVHEVVLSKDPGFTWCEEAKHTPNNVNRQIVSTKNGLKKATRKYALKLRSDLILTGTQFVEVFGKYDTHRAENCKVFKNRIITNNLYCADPYRTKFPFHISDWFQFGLTEDILNLWDIPLQTEADAYHFLKYMNPDMARKHWLFRYIPEQYIFINCLKKNDIKIECNYFSDDKKDTVTLSDLAFANNTVILDYQKCGIQFLKYDPYRHDNKAQMSHAIWQMLYKKHCNYKFECDDVDRVTKHKDPTKNDWWRGNRGK